MTTDPIAAVRRALEAALATLDAPENASQKKGLFSVFPPSARLCDACHEPIEGHGNARTHPGDCRRKRHAERQRKVYRKSRASTSYGTARCRNGACGTEFAQRSLGQQFCSRACYATAGKSPGDGMAGPRATLAKRRGGAVEITPASVLLVLRAAGPLDPSSVARAHGDTTASSAVLAMAILAELVQRGQARVIDDSSGGDTYQVISP